MRWVGGLLAISILGLGACSDPITNAVAVTELLGGKNANVVETLPKVREKLLPALAKYGYELKAIPVCDDDRSLECAEFWAPKVDRPAQSSERLHFFKQINRAGSGDTFGLLVDFDRDGRVLIATAYKSFTWVF